ncbi:hypothetical protein DOTSEDRAFT_68232 [Dothistroma septosporum NZE10]|uniref:Uncharacterized protein n=1 Tax=Dothistroma septosporum (strain NZE10 / CBS 128990) TaxID=675120 RepID=N1Q126_DOTSN|nr:hypothetical protein DOTSEDRAFT_68232 [Dothistroma septosporum NZE10]
MRVSTTIAALVAVAAVNAAEVPAPAAYDQQSMTSATTTYTITRTLSRVVETVTATRNGSLSTYESTSTAPATTLVSAAPTGYGNATLPGTAAKASASATFYSPPPSQGGAGKVEVAGFAAVMGIVGMLAL